MCVHAVTANNMTRPIQVLVFDESGALLAGQEFPTFVDGICGHRGWEGYAITFNKPCGDPHAPATMNGWDPTNSAVFKINLSEPKPVQQLTVSVGGSLNGEGWFIISDILLY